MSDENAIRAEIEERLAKAAELSQIELAAHPNTPTGACHISKSGYYECRDNMTEAGCNAQKDGGFTVRWDKGKSC